MRIKHLPNLKVGNWTKGGIRCDLNRQGKTTHGLISPHMEEEEIFDIEQNRCENSDEDEGEYILKTDFQTKRVTENGAIRVSKQEINSTSLEDYGAATRAKLFMYRKSMYHFPLFV